MNPLRIFLALLVSAIFVSTPSYAVLISQDSIYGQGSLTFDSDTGLQWLDPWMAIVQKDAQVSSYLNTYSDVQSMLEEGRYFDGFRFAKRSEIETLLYSSIGFNENATPTETGYLAAHMISFFDNALGWGNGIDYEKQLLDAVFLDDITGDPQNLVISYNRYGNSYDGVQPWFYTDFFNYNASNTTPYGFFLVRDTTVTVDEPSSLLLMGLGLLALAGLRRRQHLAQ